MIMDSVDLSFRAFDSVHISLQAKKFFTFFLLNSRFQVFLFISRDVCILLH